MDIILNTAILVMLTGTLSFVLGKISARKPSTYDDVRKILGEERTIIRRTLMIVLILELIVFILGTM